MEACTEFQFETRTNLCSLPDVVSGRPEQRETAAQLEVQHPRAERQGHRVERLVPEGGGRGEQSVENWVGRGSSVARYDAARRLKRPLRARGVGGRVWSEFTGLFGGDWHRCLERRMRRRRGKHLVEVSGVA